jgi:ABC-type multidrug transport system fused ATPase/permease subunit
MPLIAVLTNPELVETNMILKSMFEASTILGVKTIQEFLFVFGIFFFILFLFSITFKALTTYATLRFSQKRSLSISKRLMKNYLHQPYSWFLNRNSAEIGKTIFSEVGLIVGSVTKCLPGPGTMALITPGTGRRFSLSMRRFTMKIFRAAPPMSSNVLTRFFVVCFSFCLS